MSEEITKVWYTDTALPTDSDTFTLFSTLNGFTPGWIQRSKIHRFFITVWHSHAGTINEYYSEDGGTTWRLNYTTGSITAGTTADTYEFEIDACRDWKLEWVNGGTTQTAFTPSMSFSQLSL